MALLRALILIVLVMTVAVPGYSASNGNLAVSAYITNGWRCWVRNTQNIAFGTLNPLNPVNVQATGGVGVRCIGFDSTITVGVTQVTPSPLLLASGPNSIPYTLELPTSVTAPIFILGDIDIPIKAHIQGADYKLAPAGFYTDTVTVQITP